MIVNPLLTSQEIQVPCKRQRNLIDFAALRPSRGGKDSLDEEKIFHKNPK